MRKPTESHQVELTSVTLCTRPVDPCEQTPLRSLQVAGGAQTEYLLMVSRNNTASYDAFRLGVDGLLAGNEEALHDFGNAVDGATSETWTYHADLSNLP